MMNRADALKHVGHQLDNTGCPRFLPEPPDHAVLVGWQCGFEPMFVAVWSYLGGVLDSIEAVDLVTDYLDEIGWFSGGITEPDFVIMPEKKDG